MGAHPNLFCLSFFIFIFIKAFVNGRLCVIIMREDNDSNVKALNTRFIWYTGTRCTMSEGGRSHGWRTTQRRQWIFDELRNRFCTIFATDSWHLALAIRYLHALIQEDPYICNHNAMYTLVRWYLTESHHKCSRMCLWRDVDMQRIIDEPKIAVTDYLTLRRCNRLLTTG